jgi:hypothetical protein
MKTANSPQQIEPVKQKQRGRVGAKSRPNGALYNISLYTYFPSVRGSSEVGKLEGKTRQLINKDPQKLQSYILVTQWHSKYLLTKAFDLGIL